MRAIFTISIASLMLSGCAYFIDTTNQDITIETPGAHDASCILNIDHLKYRVYAPGTINVTKSDEDMIVKCRAPGNREKTIIVPPMLAKSAKYNAANAGIGLPWDYASKALFKYPAVIEVDFTNIPASSEALPAQNNPDIKQPEEYPLEEFSPGLPRLNSDSSLPDVEIRRRGISAPQPTVGDVFSESGETSGKSTLREVIDSLGSESSASSSPTPIVPGE